MQHQQVFLISFKKLLQADQYKKRTSDHLSRRIQAKRSLPLRSGRREMVPSKTASPDVAGPPWTATGRRRPPPDGGRNSSPL
ncbi:hypothetical protein QVD17_07110 [Tagetes erecta]|uniref:Uncharacterized protein n=1 Tax=Tagetes erecta TaxID=13708 RepID=A0AAD8LLY8_TARER|nr:hypothetical protein QVD17_07110 [Tagetes erecta]